ncbi:MAG: hypothetical protein RLZZ267_844 [Bacillota bacterium]|jgi:hypothetical protein
MKNVNLNRQVVNIKIGCPKGKKKKHHWQNQGCLKVKHQPEQRYRYLPRWCENICIDFRVTQQDSPQTIWRAIDLEPMGTLNLENRSFEPITLIVSNQHGHEVSEDVSPKSTLSMTLQELERIEVACLAVNPNLPCFGRLRLHLVIPSRRSDVESCKIG